jgi:hypothetical protein
LNVALPFSLTPVHRRTAQLQEVGHICWDFASLDQPSGVADLLDSPPALPLRFSVFPITWG